MCNRCTPVVAALWLAAFCVFTAFTAFADGVYMPEKAVRKIPDIPAQRALLKWKDGEETLMISSALDSESQSLGWIIPIPSVPGEIAKADPGALKTLEFCVQPRITHDLWEEAKYVTVLTLLVLVILATGLFRPKKLVNVLLLILLLFILWSMLLPAGMPLRTSPAKASSLRVEKTAKVGSYEIAVLSAKNMGDLNTWLSGNGFNSLPDSANAVVSKYIKQNWVFAAIKLTREQAGANTPHPISMTFKSSEAIYPLQLTALPGGTPMFELFVLGDQRANSDLLKTEYCDKFNPGDPSRLDRWKPYEEKGYRYFSASNSDTAIGFPEICGLMWNGCVLTKLSGAISPANMADDLRIGWVGYQPYQQHFFTTQGARTASYLLFTSLFGGFIFVSLILNRKPIKMPGGFWRWLGKRALPGAMICGAAASVLYIAAPKIPDNEIKTHIAYYPGPFAGELANDIKHFLKTNPGTLQKPAPEIAEAILAGLKSGSLPYIYWNPILDGEQLIDSTPGNFTVEKDGEKVVVNVFDGIGHPSRIEYDSGVLKADEDN